MGENAHCSQGGLFLMRPLAGIKVIDFTGVQSGPACTQMLAWLGADVLKVERVGEGDATRHQLRDIPDEDSLYFAMLNSNKRSIELNTKTPEGKEILERLIRESDVLVENFGPGAMERMGFSWERIHELNRRLIFGSIKGFGESSRYGGLKVYENVAQSTGGAASASGFWDGPPMISGAAIGDSNTGLHLLIGILAALLERNLSGVGQKVTCSMQAAVLDLCRVKVRDQQRLMRTGVLPEYPQAQEGIPFGDTVPRGGNASGGGQPGGMFKCKGWETDDNAYVYIVLQDTNWPQIAKAFNHPEWLTDPRYNTAKERIPHLPEIFAEVERWLSDKTKFEATEILSQYEIPVGPVMSMKELVEDPELRECGTIVEVDHKTRGKYLTVGNPIKYSDFHLDIQGSPLLGENTEEVLLGLGYTPEQISELHAKKVVGWTWKTKS
jgi:formyl-CoA transferase